MSKCTELPYDKLFVLLSSWIGVWNKFVGKLVSSDIKMSINGFWISQCRGEGFLQSKITILNFKHVMSEWGQSAVLCILGVCSQVTSYMTPSPTRSVKQAEWKHCASGEPLDFLQKVACWCHPVVRNVISTLTASDFILSHVEDPNMFKNKNRLDLIGTLQWMLTALHHWICT